MTSTDSNTGASGRGRGIRVPEAIAALRSIPFGGFDDSTRDFNLPPAVRASVAPALTSLRWGAVGFGIAFTAPDAFRGSYNAVIAVGVCLFITTWRTIIPIRLASERPRDRLASASDVILMGLAVGYNGGLESPFIFALMAAIAVIAFGWGYVAGAWGAGFALAAMALGIPFGDSNFSQQVDTQRDLAVMLTLVVVLVFAGFLRQRLLDAEGRRGQLAGEIDTLNDANELLALVNSVARTLPSSLTLRDALDASRRQIEQTFGARVIALLAYDENSREWVPRLADGCVLNPAYRTNRLPQVFGEALNSSTPILVNFEEDTTYTPIQIGMKSGLYSRLVARSTTVGVLALEHPEEGRFEPRHVNLMTNMAEVLALTIDNARWFGRLRTLGAEEERVRLARDLHDRLGQWLTYIGFELERIMSGESSNNDELSKLYDDVQSALDELRETLRQLRSGVNDEKPLAVMGRDLVEAFADRSKIEATFDVIRPEERLPVPIENELFRILQESLNNISKHAGATRVWVTWNVNGGNFELVIADDGRGFVTAHGVRDSAYGLVGMRERADAVGAHLEIESAPGEGTRVTVSAGNLGDWGSLPDPKVPMGTT